MEILELRKQAILGKCKPTSSKNPKPGPDAIVESVNPPSSQEPVQWQEPKAEAIEESVNPTKNEVVETAPAIQPVPNKKPSRHLSRKEKRAAERLARKSAEANKQSNA